MSILGKIMGAIFGSKADAATTGTGSGAAAAGGGVSATPSTSTAASTGAAPSGAQANAPSSSAAGQNTEVAPILDKAVAAKGEKLEWKTSIVDLMKALDIDSSLIARKELAKELGYTGDTNDSTTMNVWLHRQVMAKLAANGGSLPSDIKN